MVKMVEMVEMVGMVGMVGWSGGLVVGVVRWSGWSDGRDYRTRMNVAVGFLVSQSSVPFSRSSSL